MATLSARICAVALAFVALAPPPEAEAFGLSFGPFHLSLPIPGFRRHRHAEPDQSVPALLYPVLAWPGLLEDIFAPNLAPPWPFGYNNIFDQAFAKYSPQRAAEFCRPDIPVDMAPRIGQATTPNDRQSLVLQKLAAALGQANAYLIRSCPKDVPSQPVARLQLMQVQIDATVMALEIVHPQLQAYEQALDDEQRAKLDRVGAAVGSAPPVCKLQPASPKERLAQLDGPRNRPRRSARRWPPLRMHSPAQRRILMPIVRARLLSPPSDGSRRSRNNSMRHGGRCRPSRLSWRLFRKS